MGTGNASVIYWPKNVWIMDYSQGPTGTLVQFNETLNLRIFVSDMSGQYTKVDYGNSSGVSYFGEDLENDPVTNFGTYTDYGLSSYTFNATEYKGTMISLTGTQMYDWYQFILRTNNTDETKMYLVFDNPWYQNAVPTMNQHLDIFPFSIVDNFNDTREFGIPIDKFWVVIEANDKNPILNGTVKYWLNIASYGVEILNVSTYIGEVIYLTPPPPEWVLPTTIGSIVGGAVIAIVILIVIKKKRGY